MIETATIGKQQLATLLRDIKDEVGRRQEAMT
jgi:hypothetical protein